MSILLPIVGLGAIIWCLAALLSAVFPGHRRKRLKHAGAAFVIFLGAIILSFTQLATAPLRATEEAREAVKASEDASHAPPATPAAGAVPDAKTPVANPPGVARAICNWIDRTGLTSQPCESSGWSNTIVVTLDTTAAEGRKICAQIAGLLRQEDLSPGPDWTLHIKSPYSGTNSIAFCQLP